MIYYLVFLVTIKKEQDGSKSSRYVLYCLSLRKQLTFRYVTTGFPAKWRLRNECRNSILMTRHYLYPDLSSASDWSCRVGNLLQPIRSTPQIWVVTRHQYGISGPFLRRHFARKPEVGSLNVGCFLRLILERFRVTFTATVRFKLKISRSRK